MLSEVLDIFSLFAVIEQSATKTTINQSTRLYLIRTAVNVADESIHNQKYTNLEFTHSASHSVTSEYPYLWDPTLQNNYYNKIVICKYVSGKINGTD
jgi:hypothetical protein